MEMILYRNTATDCVWCVEFKCLKHFILALAVHAFHQNNQVSEYASTVSNQTWVISLTTAEA